MNVRFGRKFALAALFCAAGPISAGAADHGGAVFTTPSIPQPSANSSPGSHTPVNAPPQVVNQATAWSSRDAAEVLISDSEAQPIAASSAGARAATTATVVETASPVPSAVPTIGWRSHSAASTGAIRFSDPSIPVASTATGPTTASPIAAASEAAGAAVVAEGIELKLTEAALATRTNQPTTPALTILPPVATPAVAKEAAPAIVSVPKAVPAASTATGKATEAEAIRLVTNQIADTAVKTADSEEPMPAPNGSGTDERPIRVGENYDCADECCPPPCPLFWTAGVEATFLRPDLNDGSASFAAFSDEAGDFASFNTVSDDVNDFYMAPRIWVGVQGCLWGANLRYWHLNASEGSYDPTLGADGNWDGPGCGVANFGYNSCNDLDAYTVDLEITRRVCLHDCWMQFSAGVRHAEIENSASIWGAALTDDSQLFGFAGSNRASRGTGIVLGWYGRKPIYPCSCVNWFYNFRWSALWGKTETAAETGAMVGVTTTDPNAVALAGSVNNASTCVNDDMFIGEIQLGLEWDYALRCLPANAFWRIAVEYQRWSGGTGYSYANSYAGVETNNNLTALGDVLAIADSPDLDLVGLTIGTGLTW